MKKPLILGATAAVVLPVTIYVGIRMAPVLGDWTAFLAVLMVTVPMAAVHIILGWTKKPVSEKLSPHARDRLWRPTHFLDLAPVFIIGLACLLLLVSIVFGSETPRLRLALMVAAPTLIAVAVLFAYVRRRARARRITELLPVPNEVSEDTDSVLSQDTAQPLDHLSGGEYGGTAHGPKGENGDG